MICRSRFYCTSVCFLETQVVTLMFLAQIKLLRSFVAVSVVISNSALFSISLHIFLETIDMS